MATDSSMENPRKLPLWGLDNDKPWLATPVPSEGIEREREVTAGDGGDGGVSRVGSYAAKPVYVSSGAREDVVVGVVSV